MDELIKTEMINNLYEGIEALYNQGERTEQYEECRKYEIKMIIERFLFNN